MTKKVYVDDGNGCVAFERCHNFLSAPYFIPLSLSVSLFVRFFSSLFCLFCSTTGCIGKRKSCYGIFPVFVLHITLLWLCGCVVNEYQVHKFKMRLSLSRDDTLNRLKIVENRKRKFVCMIDEVFYTKKSTNWVNIEWSKNAQNVLENTAKSFCSIATLQDFRGCIKVAR